MRLPAVFVESTAENMTSLDSVKGMSWIEWCML